MQVADKVKQPAQPHRLVRVRTEAVNSSGVVSGLVAQHVAAQFKLCEDVGRIRQRLARQGGFTLAGVVRKVDVVPRTAMKFVNGVRSRVAREILGRPHEVGPRGRSREGPFHLGRPGWPMLLKVRVEVRMMPQPLEYFLALCV